MDAESQMREQTFGVIARPIGLPNSYRYLPRESGKEQTAFDLRAGNGAGVLELPHLRGELGVRSRELEILTPDSEILEISAPSWRSTRALVFTSSPVSRPEISLLPRASAASMSTRCEMLLSPGGRTTPAMRRALEATPANPSPPDRRAGEPRRQRGRVADLERVRDRLE